LIIPVSRQWSGPDFPGLQNEHFLTDDFVAYALFASDGSPLPFFGMGLPSRITTSARR